MIKQLLIKEYFTKRNKAINEIKEKFDIFYDDKHDDLNNLLSFINFADRFIQSMGDKVDAAESVALQTKESNHSLNALISTYVVDAYFNQEKAKKWFVKAINLVVVEGYEYKAPYFIKGNEEILKTRI